MDRRGELMTEETLEQLRVTLDAIDAELIDTVARRLATCRRVAACKGRRAMPVMQPDRVRAVKERVTALGVQRNVRPEFVTALYDLIIGEACRLEDALLASRAAEPGSQHGSSQRGE